MEKNFKRTTVTAALPYANGGVHIGHLAGVYVPADIYVRYLRLKKKDVIFIGGSDEHGVPVTIRARKEGISVQTDSGILPAGAILVGVMGDGMGMGAASGAIVRVATAQIIAAAGCNCL